MRRRHKFLLAIILSLLVHVLFLGLGGYVSSLLPKVADKAKRPERVVEVTVIPQAHQIADIAPPEKEEKPDKAKFLGMYDSRVPEERVAPSRAPSGGHKAASVSAAPVKKDAARRSDGKGPKLAAEPPEKKEAEKPAEKPGAEGEDFFGGLPEDYFPDYQVADHTFLNVLKYPKVSYFVRLKKIFRTTFNPVPAVRGSLGSNQISKGHIEVVLGVAVDRGGRLADLFIIRSSGLSRYDQEAVRTIRASAPFSVPPSDLLDNASLLRMAWTFTVYL